MDGFNFARGVRCPDSFKFSHSSFYYRVTVCSNCTNGDIFDEDQSWSARIWLGVCFQLHNTLVAFEKNKSECEAYVVDLCVGLGIILMI